MVVLVTGANGQLGQSLQFISGNYPDSSQFGEPAQQINFVFCTSSQLDITNLENCKTIFEQYKPDFCINTAAYTAVDKAEIEKDKAHLINVVGAQNLAEVSKIFNTILLHVSTDFVFDGQQKTPYTEESMPNPTGVYGKTKLEGEKVIQDIWQKHFIIRTSWVYSQFGNNFMKTMLRLGNERDNLSVVNDQIGTPTNAVDLAEILVKMIKFYQANPIEIFGIYNFSNEGMCSWYDFAKEIFNQKGISIDIKPILTKEYPTPAKRPTYSVLDKKKITSTFGIKINSWQESLSKCINN
jgi:dTDP-4-dehydrorhamnose reductase